MAEHLIGAMGLGDKGPGSFILQTEEDIIEPDPFHLIPSGPSAFSPVTLLQSGM
jgi:hypothetical protein